MQCDVEAVRRRYERELAPPLVTGSRALVDSGALLWRCHVTGHVGGRPAERGGLRLGARRLADHATHPVRRPALRHSAWPPRATRSGWPRCGRPRWPTPTRRSATWWRRCAARCRPCVEGEFGAAATRSRKPSPGHRRTRRQRRAARGAPGHAGLRARPLRTGRAGSRRYWTSGSAAGLAAGRPGDRARLSGSAGVVLRQDRQQHPLGHQVGEGGSSPVSQTGDDHERALVHARRRPPSRPR